MSGIRRAGKALFQERDQIGFPLCQKFLQLGQREFGFLLTGSGQTEERLGGTLGGVVEQPSVTTNGLNDVPGISGPAGSTDRSLTDPELKAPAMSKVGAISPMRSRAILAPPVGP